MARKGEKKKHYVLIIHDDYDRTMCRVIRYETEEEAIQGLHEEVADFFGTYSLKAAQRLAEKVDHFTNHIVETESEGYRTSFRVDYLTDHESVNRETGEKKSYRKPKKVKEKHYD